MTDRELREHWEQVIEELRAKEKEPKNGADLMGDIMRENLDWIRFSGFFSEEQINVAVSIASCKTSVLGGYISYCDNCGKPVQYRYRSCGNRYCPRCQAARAEQWAQERKSEMLPCPQYHCTVTLPHKLNPLVDANKAVLLDALMKCASSAVIDVCRSPEHLGATPGVIAVLHDWASDLTTHYHVHMLVSGGGLNRDGDFVDLRDIRAAQKQRRQPCSAMDIPVSAAACTTDSLYFIPEAEVASLFRGRYLACIRHLYSEGALTLSSDIASMEGPFAWEEFLASLMQCKWVSHIVPTKGKSEEDAFENLGRYVTRPMLSHVESYTEQALSDESLFDEDGSAEQPSLSDAIRYLSGSVYKAGISPYKIVSYNEKQVSFWVRDRKAADGKRLETISANAFIFRYLSHVLPEGFSRVRSYGILANGCKKKNLNKIMQQVKGEPFVASPLKGATKGEIMKLLHPDIDYEKCPCCGYKIRIIPFGLAYDIQNTGPRQRKNSFRKSASRY